MWRTGQRTLACSLEHTSAGLHLWPPSSLLPPPSSLLLASPPRTARTHWPMPAFTVRGIGATLREQEREQGREGGGEKGESKGEREG
eukprot:2441441-Rhodomonas_salina.1